MELICSKKCYITILKAQFEEFWLLIQNINLLLWTIILKFIYFKFIFISNQNIKRWFQSLEKMLNIGSENQPGWYTVYLYGKCLKLRFNNNNSQWNIISLQRVTKYDIITPLISLTLCFCSSVRTSLRTLAQGMSSGHHTGLQLSLPQPGFPRPVEYFSISGMNARSWAWTTTRIQTLKLWSGKLQCLSHIHT